MLDLDVNVLRIMKNWDYWVLEREKGSKLDGRVREVLIIVRKRNEVCFYFDIV